MPAQEHVQKAIQEANEKERHLWRHTRRLIKGLQIAIFLYLLYPIALGVIRAI
ncbi:hypothetical protein ACQK5W_00225 [Pantoea sp. FN060301]|uniref:hypothetical protein n=1 Tax=Pantoea sp. FN060301 TaxID=3420380 RepID=UPI003D16A276